MTVEYSNGTTEVIHWYGNEHLEGMRNGTLRMGVYAPEEMVLVPKSVVKELIDTHDQQYSLTKDTRLFVNMFNKLRGALSRIKERKMMIWNDNRDFLTVKGTKLTVKRIEGGQTIWI